MRTIPRLSGAALAVVLMLTACVPTTTPAGPTPRPSATPVFANEAEALAAATKAYAAYQRTLDNAFSSYDTSILVEVADGAALKKAIGSVLSYKKLGKQQTGEATIDTVSLVGGQAWTFAKNDTLRTKTYLCLDLSQVDVLGRDGRSVVPQGSSRRFPILATLAWHRSERAFLVEVDESWNGENFC